MIRTYKRYTALLLAVITAIIIIIPQYFKNSYAQEDTKIAVDPTGNGYSSVLYDGANGLPTSEANAIAETAEGFIWIGSYSGLIRYDGNTFERIDSTSGIASVVSLFVDSKNRLWVGTNDNGIAVMENGEFRMFHKSDGLPASSVRAITEDFDGNIYVATTSGIAIIDENMNLSVIDDTQIKNAYIRNLQLGKDGIIYGVVLDEAFFTIEDKKISGFYTSKQLGIDGVIAVFPDLEQEGYVYLGTENSKVYYGNISSNLNNLKTIDVMPLSYINGIYHIGNQLWVTSDNGIGVIKQDKIHILDDCPLKKSVGSMLVDYQGNLWFTSSRQGVMKIVPNRFTDISSKYDLPEEIVNSTCKYNDILLLGTDDGLIALSDTDVIDNIPINEAKTASGQDIEVTNLIEWLNGCRIRSIIRDSSNRIWISTWRKYGLICYDNGIVTCYTKYDGLPSDRVRVVYEKKDGSILAACTGGVAVIQGKSVIGIYNEKNGLDNLEILTVTEAENGDIILGSDGDGIYVISDLGTKHITMGSGLRSDVIMRVKKDNTRNIFWIVTSNSIAYMDSEYNVTTVDNFPYPNNYDLYENKSDELWILASNGIYVVSADELIANKEITPVYFGRENGISYIATANSYSELTPYGSLYIAGSSGVTMTNIDVSFESVSKVKISVPYIEVDDEKFIYPDKTGAFNIPANVNKITIFSYVYTYSLLNPQVTFYLDGFEKSSTTVRRNELVPVDYTNLNGGRYNFIISITDSLDKGSNKLSVPIIKQKAFHETITFNIAVAIAIICLITFIVRLYIKNKTETLKKKEQEQKKLITEIVKAFAKTIDMKDKYTNGHSSRVAEYTAMLTKELGYDEETIWKYYNIALLHDIGKIGVPEEVLNKPGKLTDEEFEIIKSHTTLGYDALKNISVMPELAIGAQAHHERPDGKGYPNGLKEDEIPRVAQIIAVADAFDAMYSKRPYRNRMNFETVVSIIKDVSGTQLESSVVDAFLRLVDKGKFRASDDNGGGSFESIDNIRKKNNNE